MTRTSSAKMLRRAFSDFATNSDLKVDDLAAAFRDWPPRVLQRLASDWHVWARDDQLPPIETTDGEAWRSWLFLGGRGAGKTRAGAEWIRARALSQARQRIALVGETIGDVAGVMVEGQSGLLSVHADHERPTYEIAKRRLIWPNGTIAQFFSAERPDGLRGPQFHAAWCDELIKWRHAEATWDMLQFGLRLGIAPQTVVTSTPRPLPLLKRLMEDATTVVTRATTFANRANLAPAFLTEMERRYSGTLLGKQELEGALIENSSGALWRRDWIEQQRVWNAPSERGRTVVAVDPPVTAHANSDACGIVVAARGADGRGYVLADRTLQGRAPDVWARAVVQAHTDFDADAVVVEVNQGGDLVSQVLRQIHPGLAIRSVRARRGKWLRAEPVAALYAEARVSHVGDFADLETELLTFGLAERSDRNSPDRLDALVWALTDLMLQHAPQPSVRYL
ncbi:MAG: terminase family protein [Pseudomonadota bacterium]